MMNIREEKERKRESAYAGLIIARAQRVQISSSRKRSKKK